MRRAIGIIVGAWLSANIVVGVYSAIAARRRRALWNSPRIASQFEQIEAKLRDQGRELGPLDEVIVMAGVLAWLKEENERREGSS